jgi:hypothetical protein
MIKIYHYISFTSIFWIIIFKINLSKENRWFVHETFSNIHDQSNTLWNATYYFEGNLPIDIDTNKGVHSGNTFDQIRKLTYLCIRRMLVCTWIFCPFTKFRSIPILDKLKHTIFFLKTNHNYAHDRDNEIDQIQ